MSKQSTGFYASNSHWEAMLLILRLFCGLKGNEEVKEDELWAIRRAEVLIYSAPPKVPLRDS